MRTLEDQHRLLEELLSMARQRKSAGETEWVEFKTNIGESHRSITYEGVGNYISGLANSACLKYKSHAIWYWEWRMVLGRWWAPTCGCLPPSMATRIMNCG